MTESEFFCQALLVIAGSGVFGKPNFHYNKEWAADIESAAAALLDVAIENQCVTSDELPKLKQPP
jgi:hypothetical protein